MQEHYGSGVVRDLRRALRGPIRNTSSLLRSRAYGVRLHIVGVEVCCESWRGARVRKPHRAGSKSENTGNPQVGRNAGIPESAGENTRKRAGDPPKYRKSTQKSGRDTGADTRNSARRGGLGVYWQQHNNTRARYSPVISCARARRCVLLRSAAQPLNLPEGHLEV